MATRRRLYINQLSTVLASAGSRTALINWALDPNHPIDTFEYYDLKSYLSCNAGNGWTIGSAANANTLGNFIQAARLAGIPNHVAVMGGYNEYVIPNSAESQLLAIPYGNKVVNAFHTSQSYNVNKCFIGVNSGINLELEYWWDHTLGGGATYPNGVTSAGYQTWLSSGNLNNEVLKNFNVWMGILDSYNKWYEWIKNNYGTFTIFEVYVGFFNPTGYQLFETTQMTKKLASRNTINVHAYRAPTSNTQPLNGTSGYAKRVWDYTQSRIDYLGQGYAANFGSFGKLKISLIYSFESSFSAPWFTNNPSVKIDDLHNAVLGWFNASSFPGKAYVDIVGYTLFQQSLTRAVLP